MYEKETRKGLYGFFYILWDLMNLGIFLGLLPFVIVGTLYRKYKGNYDNDDLEPFLRKEGD